MATEGSIQLLLIGCGPHAKRIYIPLFEKTAAIKSVHILDIAEKEDNITSFLQDKKKQYTTFFIKKEDMSQDSLSEAVETHLKSIIEEQGVTGVIISSEPLTHMMYALWCLQNNLTILMDKPISTHKNISTDKAIARKILTDYDILLEEYEKAIKRNPYISFSIQSQRRFHPAYIKIKNLIKQAYKKTNCPVTSIQSYHCDGQWRMPTEIVEQIYHPYSQGYGKCSHSGYHFFDIIPFFLEAATDEQKQYDNIDIFASFVRPLDFLEQYTLEDYEKLLGPEFEKNNKYTLEEYKQLMGDYGEIDAYNNIVFKKGNRTMTVATINLLHNGFTQREWVTTNGRDLYKGNGRVRHESHIIQQGPFQTIQFHSYQSKEVKKDNDELYETGGEYHLEIHVFRNPLLGKSTIEKINIKDLNNSIMEGTSRGHQEDARAKAYFEFIESLQLVRTREQMSSDLRSHKIGTCIMSGIYESAANQHHNREGKINTLLQ